MPWTSALKLTDYEFIFLPLIIRALRFVSKCLKENLDRLGFSKRKDYGLSCILQV